MIKHLYIALIFLFCATLFAQEPIRYTTKNGLPSNNIYDMVEDSNGFMWFATNRGIVKYNGETFTTFTTKDGLPNNDTWMLETDKQGRVYYLSKSKYQGYIKNDRIYKFITPDSSVVSPRFHKSNTKVWLSCKLGILSFENNKLNKEIDDLEYAKQVEKAQKKYQIKPFINTYNLERRETILVSDNKIIVLDSVYNYAYTIPLPKKTQSFYPEDSANWYQFLPNQTLFYGSNQQITFVNFNTKTVVTETFKSLIGQKKVANIYCKTTDTEIQISTQNNLLVFNYEYELLRTYTFTTQPTNQKSYQDSHGNIWLASLSKGITFIPNTSNQSISYFTNDKVQKINKLDTTLYVGVFGKGFYEFNKRLNLFNKFSNALPGAIIYNIKQDKVTNANYFISNTKSIKTHHNKEQSISFFIENFSSKELVNAFKDVIIFKDATYYTSSIVLIKKKTSEIKGKVVAIKSGLEKLIVFKNQLYVTGSDGLHILNENDKLLKPTHKNDLLSEPISSITATKNNLIVGTNGRGVYLYNKDEVIYLPETDGFIVQRIIKKNNSLWLATQHGVKKLRLNTSNLSNSKITDTFYEADGLLQDNTNDIYLQDSTLYAASDIGLAKINLNNPIYKNAPQLYFKTKNDTLHFKNGARDNVSVSFSTLDFVNQNHLQYQYRLLPLQKEWITTTVKTLNFVSLSPKLYQLEVKVTDQHNNQTLKTQYLNIIPAWWQTIYNKIGFGLVFILSFLLLINKIKRRIQKKEHEKTQQDKRISGLELQALRSQMNPHFVHNSLNAIQYFIQRNEVELSENYLSKFSKLIRLFFEYSRRQNITIKEELDLLTKYLDIEKLRFEEKLNYTISVCEAIDVEEQIIPSMLLQPIVENAVNHGLFHKKANGNIAINFKQIDKNTFQVIVKDDGIGINKAKEIYKQSSKNYQSNSSNVLYERLELLNQSKNWNINYKIQDCSEIDASKTGTLVTLTFKQTNNDY